jgi:hypothetical protein
MQLYTYFWATWYTFNGGVWEMCVTVEYVECEDGEPDRSSSEYGLMVGFYECDNEPASGQVHLHCWALVLVTFNFSFYY